MAISVTTINTWRELIEWMLLFLIKIGMKIAAGRRTIAPAIHPESPIGKRKTVRSAAKTAAAQMRRVFLSVIVAPPVTVRV